VGRKKPGRKPEPPSKPGIAWPRWTGFRGMTVRDWLQLLIVPLALVLIGFLFTMQQDARQQRIENQRAEAERELAEQRAQDEALQAYLDQMGNLVLERNLLKQPYAPREVTTLARARTLTVLDRVGPDQKRVVLTFLYETGLIHRDDPRVNLYDANLSQAKLSLRGTVDPWKGERRPSRLILSQADLSRVLLNEADLRNTYLIFTDFSGTNLTSADLSGAIANRSILNGAILANADLRATDLGSSDLGGADLRKADLTDANLVASNLSTANLTGAKVTEEQLATCASLEGATMPNGQKYEEWLKSKSSGEDGENTGAS
jgi:uncharacterized protein YjbI with pentapeptide repeats